MPSVPPSPSNYPARPGTIVDFSILRDFGTRVMHDTEWRFARVLLSMDREVTASFAEEQFARLNGHRGPLRATAGHPVFLRGPTSYMNSDAIEAADAQFAQAAERRLAEYNREMMAYKYGQVATRPEYPDLDKIPHWKADYAPHPHGWPAPPTPQPGAILHLNNPQPPLVPRSVSKTMPGRFSVFGGIFGRIPVIGTALAARAPSQPTASRTPNGGRFASLGAAGGGIFSFLAAAVVIGATAAFGSKPAGAKEALGEAGDAIVRTLPGYRVQDAFEKGQFEEARLRNFGDSGWVAAPLGGPIISAIGEEFIRTKNFVNKLAGAPSEPLQPGIVETAFAAGYGLIDRASKGEQKEAKAQPNPPGAPSVPMSR
jgi:hypothetical protein